MCATEADMMILALARGSKYVAAANLTHTSSVFLDYITSFHEQGAYLKKRTNKLVIIQSEPDAPQQYCSIANNQGYDSLESWSKRTCDQELGRAQCYSDERGKL